MKNTHVCPKCNSTSVAKIPGGTNWNGRNNKLEINSFKAVPVFRYVCTSCGFTEEWIDTGKDLDTVAKKFLDKKDPYNGGFV